MGLEIVDTEEGASGSEMAYQGLRDIDHEHSQVGAIVNGDGFDIHEILQAPELFGVAEVELDLETQAIVVNELVIGQVEVTAEQNDVSSGLGFEIGFDDDDHIQGVGKELVPHGHLIDTGLDTILHGRSFEVLVWDASIVEFVTIFSARAEFLLRPLIRKVQGGIAA